MARKPNEYHIVGIDPGGTIGIAHVVVNRKAFTDRKAHALKCIESFSHKECTGTEEDQIAETLEVIREARYGQMPFRSDICVVSEDFELTQLVGGHNLLSPIRINAVLAWECRRLFNSELVLQKRTMRTAVTRERLKLWGLYTRRMGKDEFAAAQHAITKLRTIKQEANKRPWEHRA